MEAGKITFARLCLEELSRTKVRDGIGLLAEKRLHGVLKRWVWDDESCHEQNVPQRDGKITRFVADVLTPFGEIFEIQTADLYPMRQKLAFYMEQTDFKVTVVHPLIGRKFISWMDPATGEVTTRRRSPLREDALTALAMGEADVLATRDSAGALSRQLSDRTTLDYATVTWECMVPNLHNSILSDLTVRKAMMYAIDRTTLADTVYLGMAQESETVGTYNEFRENILPRIKRQNKV